MNLTPKQIAILYHLVEDRIYEENELGRDISEQLTGLSEILETANV